MNRSFVLVALTVLFVVAEALLFLPDYDSPRIVKFLIISQVLFGLSLAIFFVARKLDFEGSARQLFLVVLIMALVARAVMLIGANDKLYLSDDVYRYVWDGKVSANGINPFRYTPQDSSVSHLKDSIIYPNINFPWVPTIYPPMAQNIFLVCHQICGDSVLVFKLVSVFFELLTVLLLAAWLRLKKIPRANLLWWLFSPLILIEFYQSAHLDILAMPFLVGTLIATEKKKPIPAGILLAMATLVKFYGLFFVPYLFFHFRGRDRWKFGLVFPAAVFAMYLPYWVGADSAVLGSLFKYLAEWRFNGSVFIILKYIMGLESAQIIVAVALVGWLVWLVFAKWKLLDKMHAAFGGYLVLTTTFFPWYFVWIFPFVLRNLSPAFLFLSGSVLLSYHVLIGHYAVDQWIAIPWLSVVLYLPFYGLLIFGAVRRRKLKTKHA